MAELGFSFFLTITPLRNDFWKSLFLLDAFLVGITFSRTVAMGEGRAEVEAMELREVMVFEMGGGGGS